MPFGRDLRKNLRVPLTANSLRPAGRRSVTVVWIAVLILACNHIAVAAELDKVILFNIQAQTLDKALLQFGAQAHVQILFAWDPSTARMRTNELKGKFTLRQALAELLKGTRLKYVAHAETVEILSAVTSQPSASAGNRARHPAPRNYASTDGPDTFAGVNDPLTSRHKVKKAPLQEVVITGSRLPTDAKEIPQEVKIYNSQEIDQSGQASLVDFLDTLPSFPIQSNADTFGIGTTISLRGLPAGTTLVLLNGRRLESSGESAGQFFDLSDIPLAAVQRVEVYEGGASAVYGSDAIGGVVNIITKKDFDGLSANARYGWAKDLGEVRSNLAWGKQFSGGGISAIASYEVDSGLPNTDRMLSASNDYTNYGGPDNNFPACSPGNVFSLTGTPLPGAPAGSSATYAAIAGSSANGAPGFGNFKYGVLNNCSLLSGLYLLPSNHRAGVLLDGHLDVTPMAQLFTEVMYTHLTQYAGAIPNPMFGVAAFQEYTVAPTNPFNPFGVTVGITGQLPGIPVGSTFDTNFFRPLVGLKVDLPRKWELEVTGWLSRDETTNISTDAPNYTAIQNALNSSSESTAINPFLAVPAIPDQVVASLVSTMYANYKSRDRSAEVYARGPLLHLPAGDVRVAIGGDYVRSSLLTSGTGTQPADYERRYDALFAEANVPIIGSRPNSASGDIVDGTLSGRRDHYSDFGTDTTEQVAINVKPTGWVKLQGTYGTAFAAPTLVELYSPDTTAEVVVNDPSNGLPAIVSQQNGGNASLKPLAGHSRTFGIVYAGDATPGLILSITNWDVVERNVIQTLLPQVIVDNATLFPGRVIRDATGDIVTVDDTNLNFGSFDVAGFDYELQYQRPLPIGTLSLVLNATETYHYTQQLAPGSLAVEATSQAEDDGDWAPKWKGVVEVGWAGVDIAGHVDGRYTGAYQDYDSIRRIGNFWIFDANCRWAFGKWLSTRNKLLRSVYFEAGATNLLNRSAQFSNFASDYYGYDAAQMSIVGRSLYFQAGADW